MSDDESYVAECGTDYYSPCCGGAVYAHFYSKDGKAESEYLCGFQCCECGKDYDTTWKDEFET